MHVEEAIELLASVSEVLATNAWAIKFVTDVSRRTASNLALSSAQATTAVNVLKQLKPEIAANLFDPGVLESIIANPTYRRPPYASTVIKRREVRYIGDGKIAFRAKLYDLAQVIKRYLPHPPSFMLEHAFYESPMIHADLNVMVLSVSRSNVMAVVAVIEAYGYHCDDATLEFLAGVPDTPIETECFADPDLGVIVADIGNSPLVGWIVTNILGGEPV